MSIPSTSLTPRPTVLGRLISRNQDQCVTEITKREYKLGRAYESDYLLSSMECSKTHCRLFLLSDISLTQATAEQTDLPRLIWMIEDLSINGTRINGKKLVKNEPVPLFNSDLIDIKPNYCLEFLSDFAKYGNANAELGDPSFDRICKHYLLTRKLGSGTYASVYLAQDLRTGIRYACKALDKSKARIPASIDNGSSIPEIEIIRHFNHPNIVRIHNYISTRKYLYIFMDLAQSGELFDYLASEGGIQEDKCKVIMYQVFKGLAYLHKKKVVHRDIKPENILLHFVGEYPRVLLADFGLAKFQPNPDYYSCRTLCGTLQYLAPEILKDTRRVTGYGPQVDMWACGVMIYYLLSCLLPFDAHDDVLIKEKIKSGTFAFDCSKETGHDVFSHFSGNVKNLIQQLIQIDPARRLTANEALQHPWFLSDKSDLRSIYRTLFKQWEASEKPGGWFAVTDPITESQALLSQMPASPSSPIHASPVPGTFLPSLPSIHDPPNNGFYSQQPTLPDPRASAAHSHSLPAHYLNLSSSQTPASP